MTEDRIKLDLEWVSEIIGDEYKKWREADVIIIESQTGTGKTHFVQNILIPYVMRYMKNLLFVCNRVNLKRQIKKDLLAIHNLEIPTSIEELDQITNIKGTTITSYQSMEETLLDQEYFKENTGAYNETFRYDYIILDECHYIFSDSSFNNTTRLVFEKLIRRYHIQAVKVFLTATAKEIREPIREFMKSMEHPILGKPWLGEHRLKEYTTGTDYSYLDVKYFKDLRTDIVTTIQNDTTDDKWIIFVSKIEDGYFLEEEFGADSVFIKSGTKHKELDSLIHNSRFERKILITTKTLDNGINIKDEQVKHIVIMAWDEITFIQMLGRRRVNIENADRVNLYIPMRDARSFVTLRNVYDRKAEEISLCNEDLKKFSRKYDNSPDEILKELFYKHSETGEWTVNPIGQDSLIKDREFAERMIEKFKEDKKFAFVGEQLSWMGLEHTFDEANLIENVMPNKERDELEKYLSNLFSNKTVMLMREDRQELIERINVRDGNNRILKNMKTLNSALEEIGSQFAIQEFETSRNKKKYKNAWRITKRVQE